MHRPKPTQLASGKSKTFYDAPPPQDKVMSRSSSPKEARGLFTKAISNRNPTYIEPARQQKMGEPAIRPKPGLHRKVHRKVVEHRLYHRLLIAGLAVALLWGTAFGIVKEIVLYVMPQPPLSEVFNSINSSSRFFVEERDDYTKCIDNEADQCDKTYDDELEAEIKRVTDIGTANTETLQDHDIYRQNAKTILNDTLNILLYLQDDEGMDVLDHSDFTSDNFRENCPKLDSFLSGQLQATNALSEYEEYTVAVDAELVSVSDQLRARERYDEEYLANKSKEWEIMLLNYKNFSGDSLEYFQRINNTLNNFAACISSDSSGVCQGKSLIDGMNEQFDQFRDIANQTKDSWESYKQEMADFYAKYSSAIAKVNDIADELGGGVGAFVSLLGIPIPDQSDAQEPSTVTVDAKLAELLAKGGLSTDSKDAFIQAYLDTLSQLGVVNDDAVAQDENLNNEIDSGNYDYDESDYNPPDIDTNTSKDAWEIQKARLKAKFEAILAALPEDESSEDNFEKPYNFSNSVEFTGNISEVLTSIPLRELDFYTYSNDIFNNIPIYLEEIVQYLVLLDIAFRIMHTVLIIRKYYKLSSLGKPPGDARVEEMRMENFGHHTTSDQRVVAIITNPFFVIFVGMVFTGTVAYLLWQIYEPLYKEYVNSCVKNSLEDYVQGRTDGTMIFRNGESMSTQYIFAQGDKLASERTDQLNVGREGDCRALSFQTNQLQVNKDNLNNALISDYEKSKAFNDELVKCLNIDDIEATYTSELQTKYGSDTALTDRIVDGTYQYAESNIRRIWIENLTALDNQIYDCSNVGNCSIACSPSIEFIVADRSYSSACVTEWSMHSAFMGNGLIIFAFICVNISRLQFVDAIVRIWWRHLTQPLYSYYGSCDKDGERLFPAELVEDNITFKEAIEKAVRQSIVSWERAAYGFLVLALLINVPWIWILLELGKDLAFPGKIE